MQISNDVGMIEFLEEAEKDMKKLDHSAQIQVLKGIMKVSKIHCQRKKADMESLWVIKVGQTSQIF